MPPDPRRGREWKRLRRRVLDRDGWRCQSCGAAGLLEVDHRIPIKAGGAVFDPDNLQALCRRCHFSKTADENRRELTPAELRWQALVEQLR